MNSNIHLFNMISSYLDSLGLTYFVRNDNQGQMVLTIEGQENMFNII